MSDLFIRLKKSISNKKHSRRVLNNSTDSNSSSSTSTKDSPRNNKHLICSESYPNRLILKKYLEMCDCQVDEVENINDITSQIKKNGEYIIIWINTNMLDVEGMECTKCLRTKLNYNGIVIALTGYMDDDIKKQFLEAGINDVLVKPFDKKEIETCKNKYTSIEL